MCKERQVGQGKKKHTSPQQQHIEVESIVRWNLKKSSARIGGLRHRHTLASLHLREVEAKEREISTSAASSLPQEVMARSAGACRTHIRLYYISRANEEWEERSRGRTAYFEKGLSRQRQRSYSRGSREHEPLEPGGGGRSVHQDSRASGHPQI